jgi:hypothetical protein
VYEGEATLIDVLDYAARIAARINRKNKAERTTSSAVRTVLQLVGEDVAAGICVTPAAVVSRSPRDASRSMIEALALAAVYGATVDSVNLRGAEYHCSFDNSSMPDFESWRYLCIDFDVHYIGIQAEAATVHYGMDTTIVTQHVPRTGLWDACPSGTARRGLLGKVGASFRSPAKRDRFFREFLSRADYVKDYDGTGRSYI